MFKKKKKRNKLNVQKNHLRFKDICLSHSILGGKQE